MKILKFSSLLQACMQGNTHWWLSQQETGKQFGDYPTISLEFFPPAHQSQRFVFLCGFYKTFFFFPISKDFFTCDEDDDADPPCSTSRK
jgi:hypothetical protein